MKATIDIPDELYRRVKAKSALEGRRVREVTIELFEQWLREPRPSARESARSPDQWLEDWFRLGEEAFRDAPPGPSAREILEADCKRLKRP